MVLVIDYSSVEYYSTSNDCYGQVMSRSPLNHVPQNIYVCDNYFFKFDV